MFGLCFNSMHIMLFMCVACVLKHLDLVKCFRFGLEIVIGLSGDEFKFCVGVFKGWPAASCPLLLHFSFFIFTTQPLILISKPTFHPSLNLVISSDFLVRNA